MDDRLERFMPSKLRSAGRRVAESRRAFEAGREIADLPRDEEGRARIVCRRHAERRAVPLDDRGRPVCYEADHPDCEGCVEDVREGRVETW
ncbi:hypothetical protein BRD10_03030 [Halobacteriales archaeon SW_12_71_31]|nr:MAG: hypothetical protein BRD10_03030 [Halobacteriales archaeon SW_12_71_31]